MAYGKQHLAKVNIPSIRIGDVYIQPSSKCRNLGVIFDCHMSHINHVASVSKSVRYHLRNLGFIRKYLNRTATEQLVHAFISSRLDFCNSLLYNLPQNLIDKLQRLQNASACLVTLIQTYNPHNPHTKVPPLAPHHRPYSLQDSPTCFSISTWYFTYLHDWHLKVPPSKKSSFHQITAIVCPQNPSFLGRPFILPCCTWTLEQSSSSITPTRFPVNVQDLYLKLIFFAIVFLFKCIIV